ncbi:preprotein translocase subunit SecE [Candidatus Fermentibacterales bacterium]|nr:preprotein translocase subunit SecE [Candidatus Fermentibacterales bacterium]
MGSDSGSNGNFLVRFYRTAVQFLGEVKAELLKVAWPTKQETVASTWVVITAVAIVAVWIFAADKASALLMSLLQRAF